MDPLTRAMFMGAASGSPEIGDFHEGGYFAGYISHTADGNATHGLIVAPAASGTAGGNSLLLQWKTTSTSTSGTSSVYDGAANTANMANSSHPAAYFCANLNINGYTDWYMPATYELEIAYYNFKPTQTANNTNFGVNFYSVPRRNSDYLSSVPDQTSLPDFQNGGGEAFATNYYYSSTETGPTSARGIGFSSGAYASIDKSNSYGILVRAFRRFTL